MPEDPFAAIAKPVQADNSDPFASIAKPVAAATAAPTAAPTFWSQPQEFLAKRANEMGEEAQRQQNQAVGPESEGKSLASRFGHGLLSYVPATAQVVDKATAGLMDWKSAAAIAAGTVLGPEVPAAYFATQGAAPLLGVTPGVNKGDVSPENVQNALLSASTMAGAAGSGASGAPGPKLSAVGELRKSAKAAVAPAQTPAPNTAAASAADTNYFQQAKANLPNATLSETLLEAQRLKDAAKVAPPTPAPAAPVEQPLGADTSRTQQFARKFTGVESALKDEVKGAAEKQSTDLSQNKLDRRQNMEDNIRTRQEALTDIDRQKLAIQQKNAGIQAQNDAQAAQVAQRQQVAQQVDQQSMGLRDKLVDLEKKVKGEGDARYAKVKAKTANDPGEMPTEAISAVKDAKRNILKGSRESIAQFNDILRRQPEPQYPGDVEQFRDSEDPNVQNFFEKYDALGEAGVPDKEEMKPVKFADWQGYSTELGDKLARGGMLGDVYQAVKHVKGVIDGIKQQIADRNGARYLLHDADQFWRNYKEDFHETEGPSGSGSPVAQARQGLDPNKIRQPFLNTQSNIGNRALDILRKYPEFGGNDVASHAENLIKNHGVMKSLPDTVSPKALVPPKEVFPLPGRKAGPPVPEAPVVDTTRVAHDAIAKRAANWGSFNARDIGILGSSAIAGVVGEIVGGHGGGVAGAVLGPFAYEGSKYYASRLLNKPGVAEWLSRTPQAEIDVLNKIPDADKVKIVNGITNGLVEGKQAVRLSPQVKAFLGPANVARIIAATNAAGSGNKVNNRKDAMELLGKSQ